MTGQYGHKTPKNITRKKKPANRLYFLHENEGSAIDNDKIPTARKMKVIGCVNSTVTVDAMIGINHIRFRSFIRRAYIGSVMKVSAIENVEG